MLAAFDLPPTLLALVDIEPSSVAEFDGQSLPDILLGTRSTSPQRDLYFRRPPDRDAYYGDEDLPDLAIRRGQWKLLCEYDGSEIELYDLTQDPSEEVNRLNEFPKLGSELASAVVRWHESMPADRGAEFVKEKKAR